MQNRRASFEKDRVRTVKTYTIRAHIGIGFHTWSPQVFSGNFDRAEEPFWNIDESARESTYAKREDRGVITDRDRVGVACVYACRYSFTHVFSQMVPPDLLRKF